MVARPHLEGEVLGAAFDRGRGERVQQAGAQLVPVPRRIATSVFISQIRV